MRRTLTIIVAAMCGLSALAGETNTQVTFTVKGKVMQVSELDRWHTAWRTTGIVVTRSKEWIGIDAVFPRSPAETAGIQSGDTLLAIGTNQLAVVSLGQVEEWLKGPTGTVVVLTIKRNGENSSRQVYVTRLDFPWSEEKKDK